MPLMAVPAIPLWVWLVGGAGAAGTAHVVAPGREDRERALAQGIDSLGEALSMENARDEADDTSVPVADATTCVGNCPPDPRCDELAQQMREIANTIEQRINDMKIDQHNLFDNHRYVSQAHPQLGSWEGHEIQIKQEQKRLEKKRREAQERDCARTPSSITRWLRSNAPSAPRGR